MNVLVLKSVAVSSLALTVSLPAAADTVLWGSSSEGPDPGSLFRVDTGTGKAELVGSSGLGDRIGDVAIDPQSGTLYGLLGSACTGATLVTIDQDTGSATIVGDIEGAGFSASGESRDDNRNVGKSKEQSTYSNKNHNKSKNKGKDKGNKNKDKGRHHDVDECLGGADALAFGPDGTLYVGGWKGGSPGGKILTVDKSSGAVLKNRPAESVQGTPAHLAGLATAPDGRIWASHGDKLKGKLHTIDPGTGSFTSAVHLTDKHAVISDLAFDDAGVLYGASFDAGKLVTITTSGRHAGKIRVIGSFGYGSKIAGLGLLGVEVLAADCGIEQGGCNPTGGQTLELPASFSAPADATIVQTKLLLTDPRVAAKTCGKEPLVLFDDDPAVPDLIIPEYLCGSPQFVVLRTQSNLFIQQGTLITTNEPGAFFDDPLSCDSPITGDPQQQDVMVWQTTDSSEVEEGHALELTFECGSSRGRTRGLSYFVVGMHIDFGVSWDKNPWQVKAAFVDLTDVKLHYLTLALVNARPSLNKRDYAKLLTVAGLARIAFKFRLYEIASHELTLFIKLLEGTKFAAGSDFNHHGNLEMRSYNAKFMIDEKIIGLMH